jgi:hypothetical protein
MSAVLEEVAAAADEVATEQRQVARKARFMQRLRDRGWSWAGILEAEKAPGLLELMRHSTKRLAGMTGGLATALAAGLHADGQSRRQIAGRLGVTHQRISAMLNRDRSQHFSEHE